MVATRFFGRYQHTLDDKGRLILPAEFRKALEDGAFIGQFPGGCLAIYTPERFDEVSEDITLSAKQGEPRTRSTRPGSSSPASSGSRPTVRAACRSPGTCARRRAWTARSS